MHYLRSPLINIGQPKLIKVIGLFLGQVYYKRRYFGISFSYVDIQPLIILEKKKNIIFHMHTVHAVQDA